MFTFVSGNILVNVGPTKDGVISPIFQQRLEEIGNWLAINGEAIYGTRPWNVQKDAQTSGVWYTSKSNVVYLTVLWWPSSNVLTVKSVTDLLKTPGMKITMLGTNGDPLKVHSTQIYFRDDFL